MLEVFYESVLGRSVSESRQVSSAFDAPEFFGLGGGIEEAIAVVGAAASVLGERTTVDAPHVPTPPGPLKVNLQRVDEVP